MAAQGSSKMFAVSQERRVQRKKRKKRKRPQGDAIQQVTTSSKTHEGTRERPLKKIKKVTESSSSSSSSRQHASLPSDQTTTPVMQTPNASSKNVLSATKETRQVLSTSPDQNEGKQKSDSASDGSCGAQSDEMPLSEGEQFSEQSDLTPDEQESRPVTQRDLDNIRMSREGDGGAETSPGMEVFSETEEKAVFDSNCGSAPVNGQLNQLLADDEEVDEDVPFDFGSSEQDELDDESELEFSDQSIDGVNGIESFIETIPLSEDQDKWPDPSKNDDWCFICEKTDTPSKIAINKNYKNILNIFENPDGMQRMQMCKVIQAAFMRDFYPFQERGKRRIWTLNSIRKHAEKHGGMSHNARIRDIETKIFTCIQHVTQNMLLVRNKNTGQKWLADNGLKVFLKLVRAYKFVHKT